MALEGVPPDPYRGTAIFAVNPETGQSERVVEKASQPQVSADGRTIVYVTVEGINGRMPDGTSRLIQPGRERGVPVLSSDGKEIVYSFRSRSNDVRSVETWRALVGGEPQKLSIPETDGVLDWSQDGQWFLTQRRTGGDLPQLFLMRADGMQQRRLDDGTTLFTRARFSPDGNRIVYMHQKEGNHNALWVMDRDGGNRVQEFQWRFSFPPANRALRRAVRCEAARSFGPEEWERFWGKMTAGEQIRRGLARGWPRAL